MTDANRSRPYGPNSDAIRRFLVRFAGLSATDRAQVVAAYTELAVSRRWIAAEQAMADAITRSDREGWRDALSGPLLQLVRRPDAPAPTTEAEALEALDPVAEPTLAALLALLVRDLLPGETVDLLLSPFALVLERVS
jgi:hypothetical protein